MSAMFEFSVFASDVRESRCHNNHLSQNNLCEVYQFSCCQNESTETDELSVFNEKTDE